MNREAESKNLSHKFDFIKTLGEGSHGKVKLGVDVKSQKKYAVKIINKKKLRQETDEEQIWREINILRRLQHPNIIHIERVFETDDEIAIVLEYVEGGELYYYIERNKGISKQLVRKLFGQIVSAVAYCHARDIAHRDLKLENILLDSDLNAKIADFGFANYFTGLPDLTTYCGSPLYASPEIINNQPYRGPEVDCWSLGVLLYALIYRAMPFDGSDFNTLRSQITRGDVYKPASASDAHGLIRKLLTVDISQRATISDVQQHWWLRDDLPEHHKLINMADLSLHLPSVGKCPRDYNLMPIANGVPKPHNCAIADTDTCTPTDNHDLRNGPSARSPEEVRTDRSCDSLISSTCSHDSSQQKAGLSPQCYELFDIEQVLNSLA